MFWTKEWGDLIYLSGRVILWLKLGKLLWDPLANTLRLSSFTSWVGGAGIPAWIAAPMAQLSISFPLDNFPADQNIIFIAKIANAHWLDATEELLQISSELIEVVSRDRR